MSGMEIKEGPLPAVTGGGNRWFTSYLLSNIAAGLIAPLIPLYVVLYLHSGVFDVGMVSSIASAASVPALIFWGNLSDYAGKRRIFILTGFVGAFAALLQIIFVHDLTGYIVMLVLFQLLAMAAVPVSTLIILETRQESEWPQVMSLFSTLSSAGTVAGLAAGTVLILYWHYSGVIPAIYLIASFVYLTAAVSAYFFLPEPGRILMRQRLQAFFSLRIVERARHFPQHVLHIIPVGKNRGNTRAFSPVMRKYLFTTTFLMFGFQVFFVPYPVFFLDLLHGTETQVFALYLLNSGLSMLTFRIAGTLVRRSGPGRTLTMGIVPRIVIFTAAGGLPFLAGHGPGVLAAAVILYGILGALWSLISIGEVTSISRLALKVNRGKAVGYYNSLLGVGQIGGGLVSGILAAELGYTADFIIAAVIVLAGFAMITRFYPVNRRKSENRLSNAGPE